MGNEIYNSGNCDYKKQCGLLAPSPTIALSTNAGYSYHIRLIRKKTCYDRNELYKLYIYVREANLR